VMVLQQARADRMPLSLLLITCCDIEDQARTTAR
jgi:hypothetical protein